MASVSTSHLILFIASILIATSVAGTFTQGVQRLSSALGDKSITVTKDIETNVEIISDTGSGAVANDDAVTLLVKNTGSRHLEASSDQLEVLLDGTYQTNVAATVVDGPTWGPGNVAKITISLDTPLDSGDHRVKIVVNGDEEVLRFRT